MNRLTAIRDWRRLLVVFIIGMLVGLFVLGWGLFPVNWTNANLRDLREDAQNNYLAAVADAYATSGNFELAQQRLKEWTPAEARTRLDKLVARFSAEGRIQQAQNVQVLADAVQAAPQTTAPPATTPAAAGVIQRNSSLLKLLGLLMGVLIIGAGLGLLAWMIFSRRQQTPATITAELRPFDPLPATDEQPGEIIGVYNADVDVATERPVRPQAVMPGYRPAPPMPDVVRIPPEPAPLFDEPAAFAPEARSETDLALGKRLAEFDAIYHQGDADYDEAFVVKGELGTGYPGECGMGIADALDAERTQATALEVWLFDKSDIHTVTTVLVSDYVQNNPARGERLAEKGDILLIAPNQVFTIQAKALALQSEVTRLDYAEDTEQPHSVFAQVKIHLTVYAIQA